VHILLNKNTPMQCCENGVEGPTLIRHYRNRDRPCKFAGEPSRIEAEHLHSWQCAQDKKWPANWTMECLECGYEQKNDFFSNIYDIAGCGERTINVGGMQIASPFPTPFYNNASGVGSGGLTPLPRMKIQGTRFSISGTDLCQTLDLYPNVLSLYETFLIEGLQRIFEADQGIEFVIEMEIIPPTGPDGATNNNPGSIDFADAQQIRNDEVERLRNSRLVQSILDIRRSLSINTTRPDVTINTTRPDGTMEPIEKFGDPLSMLKGPPGMGRQGPSSGQGQGQAGPSGAGGLTAPRRGQGEGSGSGSGSGKGQGSGSGSGQGQGQVGPSGGDKFDISEFINFEEKPKDRKKWDFL